MIWDPGQDFREWIDRLFLEEIAKALEEGRVELSPERVFMAWTPREFDRMWRTLSYESKVSYIRNLIT